MKTWELSLPNTSVGTVTLQAAAIWGSNGQDSWGHGSKGALSSMNFGELTRKLTLTSDNVGGEDDYYGVMVRYKVLTPGADAKVLNFVHSEIVDNP